MKKQEIVLTRMTEAKSQGEYLPISAFSLRPELFRWREVEELSESQLKGIYDSLVVNGQEEPIEYAELDGKLVVVKGHRRLAAFQLMIDKQVEGITPELPVLAKRVENATLVDLVARSINDNVNRATISEFGRVKAALKLRELGEREERVRVVVGVSETTLARYYRLGDHQWMWEHVVAGNLRLTDAHNLLEAAVNTNRADKLKEDLAAQFSRITARITALEARKLEDENEPLDPSERLMKNHIETHEMETWLAATKQGKSFGSESKWVYRAAIVEERKGLFVLKIPALSIKLVRSEADRVRTVKERFEKVLKDLRSHSKRLDAEVEIERAQHAERVEEAVASSTLQPPPVQTVPPPSEPAPQTNVSADPAFGRTRPRQLTDPLADAEIPDSPSSGPEEAKS